MNLINDTGGRAMNRQRSTLIICIIITLSKFIFAADSGKMQTTEIQSPNKKITVSIRLSDKRLSKAN